MLKWILEIFFVLLVNLYGGFFVVSYLYDSNKEYIRFGGYSVLLDDNFFRYLVSVYVMKYLIMGKMGKRDCICG